MMKKLFETTLTIEHPVIKSHLVHGEALLPGLAYIDMLYQLAHDALGLEYNNYRLKNLSIFEPLIVKEDNPAELKIFFEHNPESQEGNWKISVMETRFLEKKNNRKVSTDKLYITSELQRKPVVFTEKIDLKAIKKEAEKPVDMEDVYANARELGLVHQGMLKAQGAIYPADAKYLIEVKVAKDYQDEAERILFHPALIDGAGMAAGAIQAIGNPDNKKDLYLPLYYEDFFASEPLRTQCYVTVNLTSMQETNDIRVMNLTFYNETGKQVACLKGITAKRVRFKEQINLEFGDNKRLDKKPIHTEVSAEISHDNADKKDTEGIHFELESLLCRVLANYLKREIRPADFQAGFFELGLESAQLLTMVKDIERELSVSLSPTLLFEYSNLDELLSCLTKNELNNGNEDRKTSKEISKNKKSGKNDNRGKMEHAFKSPGYCYEFHEQEAFLQDHLVYGQPALMGVVHPCLVVETYLANHPKAYPVELKNIQFTGGPVTLQKKETVHILVELDENNRQAGFKTVHYVTDSGDVKPNCQGDYIGFGKASSQAAIDLQALLRQAKPLDKKKIMSSYDIIKDFTIGPMLQTIEAAFYIDNLTLIGRVDLANKLKKGNMTHFAFDPLLLNSCYMLTYSPDEAKSETIFIPLAIERITLRRPMTETAYIVKTIRRQKAGFGSFDALIVTDTGEIIAEIVNASLKEVLNPSLLNNASFEDRIAADHKTIDDSNKSKFTTAYSASGIASNTTKNILSSAALSTISQQEAEQSADIAIVSLAGRYPGAANIEEFWKNLQTGKDCISEIPEDRWDNSLYYEQERGKPGKSYCKWGGFLEGVDLFDALFFNISPSEAEIIDPLDRLFLETVWNLLERAGYTRERLSEHYQGRVGVYVGAMYQQYHLLQADIVKEAATAISSYGSIANRVSHFFNLFGPSVAIDTMCSSAAMAIHLACESLHKKECEMAIAGGVNLSLHPKKYLGLSLTKIIGSDFNRRSFGAGDGLFPAEGVGAVLLKPLAEAIRMRDPILAVIKSTATNHCGRSNGYCIPNPKAQARLIADNFRKSGIEPRTISYIEAAATGSPLGDPIEISALKNVFGVSLGDNSSRKYCAMGSVKSNIGHAEAASGISQLTKVVLQLQHQQLVPTIKADPLNPNINLDNSPFYLQQELQDWKRPLLKNNGYEQEQEYPRRATVSSFGAGGTNVHLIVEEYPGNKGYDRHEQDEGYMGEKTRGFSQNPLQIIPFSARNPERLQAVARKMLNFYRQHKELSLLDIAYTLQLGREAMEVRLVVLASTIEELIQGLEDYLKGVDAGRGFAASRTIFTGDTTSTTGYKSLLTGRTGAAVVQVLLAENNLEKLAVYWTQGGKVSWERLYQKKEKPGQKKARIIALPAYPFEKRSCWLESVVQQESEFSPPATMRIKTNSSLQELVVDIVSHTLGLAKAELNSKRPLEDYGLDSILLMSLFQQLQSQLDYSLTLEKLQGVKTTQDIIDRIDIKNADMAVKPTAKQICSVQKVRRKFPELLQLNGGPQGQPVFWFHEGIGGVEGYQEIAQRFKRPFYGIQARGWLSERVPITGIQGMASYYIHMIQSIQSEGPYDLGGCSLGGDIAYEVARQLQELGESVTTMVMIDTLDSQAIKKIELNEKTPMLQMVNIALLSGKISSHIIGNAAEKAASAQLPIHRDEVGLTEDNELFLEQLLKLAKQRGITRTDSQLRTMIKQAVKVQQAYEIDKYFVLPLPNPQEVTCYYFRNKSGLFFGELEPYFSAIPDPAKLVEDRKHWEEWEQQFPNFHLIDVDSPNHMAVLSSPKSYEVIAAICEKLYSGEAAGVSVQFLESF
jgi:thioesterase domain-containing protein/3-oxoacyl-(acyl-carrier-protein) synthase/acyl carrier protein